MTQDSLVAYWNEPFRGLCKKPHIPLPEPVGTFDLAVVINECLKAQGIAISTGQVEVFPNVKSYGVSICIEHAAHRLPFQPGSGSCFLDDDLNPAPGNLSRFLWAFDLCGQQQDMGELVEVFKVGRDNHRESVRTEISRFVIAKESLDKALKVFILRSA